MEKVKIGYFDCRKIEDKFIGAIMVTDSRSVPLEFKYTEPVIPTKIHKIIFGKVMEKYIIHEVIKKTLFKDLQSLPFLLFVPDISLLQEESFIKSGIVAVNKTSLPALSSAGETQRVDNSQKDVLIQPGTLKNPLKITFSTLDIEKQEKIIVYLKSLVLKTDIYEPFERIDTALQTLCQAKN